MKSSKKQEGFLIFKNYFKKSYDFIFKDDSLLGNIAFLVFAYISIKFIIFPFLGFVLGTSFPLVAIVSGSMEHKIVDGDVCGNNFFEDQSLSFDKWWEICGNYYNKNLNLTKGDFLNFDYQNGLNIGDVMILRGKKPKDIQVGEILIFVPGDSSWYASHGPVIHRVVKKEFIEGKYYFTTKGDHNPNTIFTKNFETKIPEDRILATSLIRIPYLGYFKVWISKLFGVI